MVAIISRRMTAPVRVDGRGPFPFIVDTGANQSVVSEELARRLHLPAGPSAPLNGVAGIQIAPTTVATLEIGGSVPRGRDLVAPAGGRHRRRRDARARWSRRQADHAGFRGETLRIESAGRLFRNPAEIALKARRRNGQLTLIDADLDGIPITAFLDSGAQNTIGNLALLSRAERRAERRWVKIPILSATGQTISAEMADLPHLRVGGLRLPNWPVAFADLHTFRMWNLTDKPAILLGIDVLSRFETVCLDFARNEVRFRLPRV